MDVTDAYQTLKTCIELDDDTIDAYEIAIGNPQDYTNAIKGFYTEIKSSIEIGQSMVSLGELVRQFYNATHRQIDDIIVDLPGSEFCKDIGEVANKSIQQTIEINRITEEYATIQLSCDETVDMSYM